MPGLKALRILLMEDDLGLARLSQEALERHGYDADFACDGQAEDG